MANTKASKKDIMTNSRNHSRNISYKSRMKTYLKKAVTAIEQKTDDRKDVVQTACRIVDKTAQKGVIKKQTAARKKSRLTLALNKTLAA